MRIIVTIAKNELKIMFYSPIAWLMLIIFIVQSGLFFGDIVENIATTVAATGRDISFLSYIFFNDSTYGLFPKVQQYLFLYIPLLTMGLMSREMGEGSIKLLYSSPIDNTQIVLGKYLAMLVYILVMIGSLFAFVALGPFTIKDFDYPQVLIGMLGLYLLAATYAAIGLYMSSLTTYQPVAAVATMALLAVLNFVGNIGQEYAWFRDITYWLSINGRSDQFINGLMCSEDVIYFMVIPTLFLLFTIFRMTHFRNSFTRTHRFLRYAGLCIVAVGMGYVSSLPHFMAYYDASATKRNTLSRNSQTIMKEVGKKPKITTYVNLMDERFRYGNPREVNNDIRRFRQYTRFRPDLKMKYVYYYTNPDREALEARFPGMSDEEIVAKLAETYEVDAEMFLSPEEMKREMDLSKEKYRFVRKIETADGRSTFLRLYDDQFVFPNEGQISAAFKRLVHPPSVVGFLTGHGERDITKTGDRNYSLYVSDITFRYSLVNNGFDSRIVSLSDSVEIPDEVDILVIADVREPLHENELFAIKKYIDKGGNLLIAGDVGRQAQMSPITESLGVRFLEGSLANNMEEGAQNLIYNRITKIAADSSRVFRGFANPRMQITMLGAVGLEYDTGHGFDVLPILTSDSTKSWLEVETTDFAADKAVLNPEKGEEIKPYTTLLQLTRKVGEKKQRIVISGDADFCSNSELIRSRGGALSRNFELTIELFRQLSDEEYPVLTPRKPSADNTYYLSVERIPLIRIIYVGLYPLIFLVLGIVILIRRKSK
jgi:ABC-2 type transport system permease protein